MAWYGIVGLIAAVCIAAFTTPQLIHVLKNKNTCGLSVIMLSLLVFGDLCFALNGIGILADAHAIPDVAKRISAGLPILLANSIASIISGILLFLKARSMYYAKVFGITEKVFCDNYATYKTKIQMIKAEKAAQKAQDAANNQPQPPQQPEKK